MLDGIQSIQISPLVIHYEAKNVTISKEICFEKGRKYGIIGSSGCGKSSLLKILMGEISNYDGTIVVKQNTGASVHLQKEVALRKQVAYVNQFTYLFNGTLFENIVLGKNYTKEEVIDVMEKVKLDEFIPEYEIIENGKNLSGGQRQKIALARALIQNKEILILDEATANLDPKARDELERFVVQLPCMVVMISHHLTKEITEQLDCVIELG